MNNLENSQKDTILAHDNNYKLKIVLVGDSGVGQTSVFWRFTEDIFPEDDIPNPQDLLQIYLWDTAGQEKYRSVVGAYFKATHGFLMVFDLTKPQTFTSLITNWFQLCKDKCPDAVFLLMGNKSDLPNRKVKKEEIDEFANSNNIRYYEISALQGTSIEQAFEYCAQEIKIQCFDSQKQVQKLLFKGQQAPVGSSTGAQTEEQSDTATQEGQTHQLNKSSDRNSFLQKQNDKQKSEQSSGCC